MKVYERETGRNKRTQPDRSWWLDDQTRDGFDRAVAKENLRMRGMKATDHDLKLEQCRGEA